MVSEFELALSELGDGDRSGSRKALLRLSGPSREECRVFLACLRGMSAERKRELVAGMVEYAEERFELDYNDLFRVCFGESDPDVRRLALEGLWEDERPDLVEPLLQMVAEDPDALVRAAAAKSLGRFGYLAECEELDPARAAKIRAALERVIEEGDMAGGDQALEVTRRAIESIAFINDDDARRIIDRAYLHEDQRMRESAVFAMGRSADRFWTEIVLEELDSRVPPMRYEAARACGELELKRAVEPLIRLLADPDAEVHEMAIWSLGQIGGKRAKAALEYCLNAGMPAISEAAEQALQEMEFANPSFDLMVHDPAASEMITIDLEDDADDGEFSYEALEETDSDGEEWPDELLDLI